MPTTLKVTLYLHHPCATPTPLATQHATRFALPLDRRINVPGSWSPGLRGQSTTSHHTIDPLPHRSRATHSLYTMAGKKGGENSKKVAGNARKADAAGRKAAEADARQEAAEADEWSKGAKSSAKK